MPPPPPGSPGWGQPPPYRYYAPPRRRRSTAGMAVVFCLGVVAFIFVVGVIALNAVSTSSSTPSAGSPIGSSTPGSSYQPTQTTSTSPSPGETTGTTSSGAQTATANRLYTVTQLNGYSCQGRQIAQGVPSSFDNFLNATANCLDRTWTTAFRDANLPFRPPTRVFWTSPGRSPCGNYPAPGAAAFYCPLNDAMYIGVEHAQDAAGGLPVRYNVAYAREVAHEYGHHVQEQAGILEYSHNARMQAGSIDERNAITRRSELQAQCLAGAFMSSVRPSFPITDEQWRMALRDSYGRGDDPSEPEEADHGSRRHYMSWLNYAFVRGSPSVCNTWTADPSDVS